MLLRDPLEVTTLFLVFKSLLAGLSCLSMSVGLYYYCFVDGFSNLFPSSMELSKIEPEPVNFHFTEVKLP